MKNQPNLSKFVEVYKRLIKEGRVDLSKLEPKPDKLEIKA